MIRDITLGQYYPGDSLIHKLDPRVKIIATLLFIIELFIVDNFIGFAICGAVLAAVIIVSKVPLSFIMRGLKPILFILFFTFALNIFMVKGEVIWSWGILHITKEGVRIAVFMAIRLVLLIIGSSMLTLATKPLSLTDGIERLLSPLARFGFPSHEIAMMMTIALRFIPTLLEETDKIMKAQQARGADFESGNLLQRAKAMVPILVPLFISAFRRADDLATAMESRCYRGDVGRTRMNELVYSKRDKIAYIILLVCTAILIASRYLPLEALIGGAGGTM
jgi:energy-coupling factor transport system permease protein